jgi:hypothetical protein
MNRRSFLQSATASTALVWCRPLFADAATRTRTEWVVRGSEGFDALSFLSPLSGDPFYLDYYRDQVAAFAPLMPADTMATLKAIVQRAQAAKILFSPFLDLRFSAGPDPTIDDLLASAAEPDARLMRGFRASPYWHDSENDWQQFKAALPALASILSAMKAAGFPEFLSRIEEPKRGRLEGLRAKLTRFDPIAGAEFYTGRTFDRKIEIILLEFCKPHGIKVIGQRFLSAIDWPDDVHIRTAGHEILHPPLDKAGPAFTLALKVLEQDALLARIVKEHDAKFGYNSLDGLFEEDLVSAIDQLIAEQFGIARKARDRWNDVDDGMHVLSAGLYGLMKQDGYARTGGNLERWLLHQAKSGALAPRSLHAAAARVLGRPEDRLWPLSSVPRS